MPTERIAFLGLGVMGHNIASNLLKAGYPLTVYNRTPGPAEKLAAAGAQRAATPCEAVRDADIIMVMLSDDRAIEAVVFGPDGVLAGSKAGQTAIDLTTCSPAMSQREAQAFNAQGVQFLDAPVFGSRNEAQQAGLWMVVGGPPEVFDRLLPIFRTVSATQHYMGENGSGTAMKLVGNLIVALQLEALGESLTLATKAGLKAKDVLGVLAETDFRSPLLSNVGEAVSRRDFSPFFYLKLMLKDANLISQFATELNVAVPASAVTREIIKAAVNQGWGDENSSALIKMIEQMAGVETRDA